MSPYIRWFRELGLDDVALVGGKNASLGEMVRELAGAGVRVPNGFAITAEAYRDILRRAGLEQEIAVLLRGLDPSDVGALRARGQAVRDAIHAAPFPPELEREVCDAYEALCGQRPGATDVAVRSSATAEDLPEASFAGQQETYLNVRGHHALLAACHRSFASLFTDRAISYRAERGYDHMKVALSIGVQQMVRSDLACAGVMFSIDTETGFPDVVLINAAYGLGENVVQGLVTPDEFLVHKPLLGDGYRPILRKRVGSKEFKLVYDEGGGRGVRNVPVAAEDRARLTLEDDEVLALARFACRIEEHYSTRRGVRTPMDMEWAKDGETGELYVLQARPETVQSQKRLDVLEAYHLAKRGTVLITGRSVGQKIASGPVHVIRSAAELASFRDGEILVTDKTDPDWEPIMKKAAAIVTDRGGRTCHAAIVSREIGLPAIVGTEHGTALLRDGQSVTVSCAEGDEGYVYDGSLAFEVTRLSLDDFERPRTTILMNLGNPAEAFRLSALPTEGVGLARIEFIIATSIQVHPLALVEFDRLDDAELKATIEKATGGARDKPRFFVDKLAEGVGTIAAAFYPREVIVRLSDFKTNEYAHLLGGHRYEPTEENPMIGFRGASRYYDQRYREGFALECRAMKKVRDEMGLRNVKLMVPFCRTVEEGRRVLAEMETHGLRRGDHDLEVYVMCEIPSNVILAEQFADVFDGFSIGSNDLTQLVLGVDRDSSLVAHVFDERNPAVTSMIASVIRAAHRRGRKIGICGQAPSDYPDFARFLVREGIDSISLNPDAVVKTSLAIAECERGTEPIEQGDAAGAAATPPAEPVIRL
jgi:pyruvate,water dikinase